jgi:predicted TIM-barrel enzyme
MRHDRQTLLDRFRAKIAGGQPLIGGGAGTGLSAKCEEAGGIDLIVIYDSGRFRMAGRGSLAGVLAYGNANDIVMDMAREVLPVVRHTPVLAGVNGTDPFCNFDHFLDQLRAMGFAGIQNFPTVGLIDGLFRQNLEETGMSYALEVDLVARAREKDMLTTPYVFDEAQAGDMARAGADIVVAHMGLTSAPSRRRRWRCGPMCWSCATAAPSPNRTMRPTFLTTCGNATAFTGPAAWSGCRPNRPSSPRSPHSEKSAAGPERRKRW